MRETKAKKMIIVNNSAGGECGFISFLYYLFSLGMNENQMKLLYDAYLKHKSNVKAKERLSFNEFRKKINQFSILSADDLFLKDCCQALREMLFDVEYHEQEIAKQKKQNEQKLSHIYQEAQQVINKLITSKHALQISDEKSFNHFFKKVKKIFRKFVTECNETFGTNIKTTIKFSKETVRTNTNRNSFNERKKQYLTRIQSELKKTHNKIAFDASLIYQLNTLKLYWLPYDIAKNYTIEQLCDESTRKNVLLKARKQLFAPRISTRRFLTASMLNLLCRRFSVKPLYIMTDRRKKVPKEDCDVYSQDYFFRHFTGNKLAKLVGSSMDHFVIMIADNALQKKALAAASAYTKELDKALMVLDDDKIVAICKVIHDYAVAYKRESTATERTKHHAYKVSFFHRPRRYSRESFNVSRALSGIEFKTKGDYSDSNKKKLILAYTINYLRQKNNQNREFATGLIAKLNTISDLQFSRKHRSQEILKYIAQILNGISQEVKTNIPDRKVSSFATV